MSPRLLAPTFALAAAGGLLSAAGQAPPASAPPSVPLCPGLTIVTAVSQPDGDYESIKTIESVDDTGLRLKYSVERAASDFLTGVKRQEKFSLLRSVRRVDLESATLYEQQFSTELPELIPETTAIGTSKSVLNALKTTGKAQIGIFIAYSQTKPSIDRNQHPNVYDNQMVAPIARVGTVPVMVPVILNDVPVSLPAIQAHGDFFGDETEFLFLDDPANPLTLRYRFGIGGVHAVDAQEARSTGTTPHPAGDRDVLQVIKISARCGGGPPAGPAPSGRGQAPGGGGQAPPGGSGRGAGTGSSGANALEQALASTGKVDVYSIYFSFNSDAIRDESEPTLKDIAEVLRRHPDWRLAVNGHTDGIGGDQANLDLSRRRAAAVKDALARRYSVDGSRLATAGFGKSQPKDTNATVEGRAHNRRVELVRS